MDEPFSAVDEQTRRKFQEELLGVVASQKKTFIFVTHSIEEAVYVSHSIALLLPPPGNNDLWHRPDCSGNPISVTSRMQPMRNGSKIFIQGHEQARVESKNIYLKKGAEKRALLTTEEFKEIVDREVR